MTDLAAREIAGPVLTAAAVSHTAGWSRLYGGTFVVFQSDDEITHLAHCRVATRPAWKEAVDNQLAELCTLPNDWDSYGSRRPHDRPMALAQRLLDAVMSADDPAPWIVPTSRRGVDLEWRFPDAEVLVGISPDAGIEVSIDDAATGSEREGHLTGDDLWRITQVLRRHRPGDS